MKLAHPRSVGDVPPGTDRADRGTSAAEYSLALTGVAALVLVALFGLGDQLKAMFDCLSEQLGGAVACSSDTPADPGGTEPGGTEPGPGPTGPPNPPPITETTPPLAEPPPPSPSPSTTTATTTTVTTSYRATTSIAARR